MKKLFQTLVLSVAMLFGASAHAVDVGIAYSPTLKGTTAAQNVTRGEVTVAQPIGAGVFVDGGVIQTQNKTTNALTNEVEASVGYNFGQCYVKGGLGEKFGAVNSGYYQVATGGQYALTDTVKAGLDIQHRSSFTTGRGQYTLAKVGATFKVSDSVKAGVGYVKTYGDTRLQGLVASVSKSF